MAGIDTTKLARLIETGAAVAPTFVKTSQALEREYTRIIDRATNKLTRIPESDPRDARASALMDRLENLGYISDLYENPKQTGAPALLKLIAEIDAL